MAITAVDKMKIGKYLKEHAVGDIFYLDMCDYLAKRGKISDIEFLEYFTDCVANEFRKTEKISVKQVIKLISVTEAFVVWVHEAKSEVREETLDKIRSFKEFYEEYLIRNVFDSDDDIMVTLDSITETVNELYPQDKKSESVSKYINQIAELQLEIKGLQKELAEVTRLYENLQVSFNQKDEQVVSLQEQNITLGKDVRGKKKEIDTLTQTIESLNARISELESLLTQAKEEITVLEPYKAQFETLQSEVQNLRSIIEEDSKAKRAEARYAVKCSKIESLIYQKLLLEGANIDELVRYVKEQGLTTNSGEVATLLRRVKQRINVDSSSFSLTPNYRIVQPRLVEDELFTIDVPFGCKYYDIMLVSDFHIKELDRKVLSGFDALNDYCTKNGIRLVLNLGDFYQGFSARPLDYENAIKNYKVVEQAISTIPRADDIYHAVLGGNHDRNIANYGFDPISMLASEREDFINLGYTHSTISLANPTGILGIFDIHHPDTFNFPISLDENGIDIGEITEYLSSIYTRQGRNKDESYIDILGHTHRSQFNYPGSYYFLPPFFEGGSKKGACHLRIYFDEDTGIKYMVFMPLNFSNSKLVQNNEIVYQKVLTR